MIGTLWAVTGIIYCALIVRELYRLYWMLDKNVSTYLEVATLFMLASYITWACFFLNNAYYMFTQTGL